MYDRAQIFVGSTAADRLFVGKLERWSHNSLVLSAAAALPGSQLDILVIRNQMMKSKYGSLLRRFCGDACDAMQTVSNDSFI